MNLSSIGKALALLCLLLAPLTACERGVHLHPNRIIIQSDFPGDGSNYATDDWDTVEI